MKTRPLRYPALPPIPNPRALSHVSSISAFVQRLSPFLAITVRPLGVVIQRTRTLRAGSEVVARVWICSAGSQAKSRSSIDVQWILAHKKRMTAISISAATIMNTLAALLVACPIVRILTWTACSGGRNSPRRMLATLTTVPSRLFFIAAVTHRHCTRRLIRHDVVIGIPCLGIVYTRAADLSRTAPIHWHNEHEHSAHARPHKPRLFAIAQSDKHEPQISSSSAFSQATGSMPATAPNISTSAMGRDPFRSKLAYSKATPRSASCTSDPNEVRPC